MSVWSGKPVSRPTKVPDFWLEAPPPIQFDAAVTRWYPAKGEPASTPHPASGLPLGRPHLRIGDSPVGRGGLHDSEDAAMRNPFRGLRIGGRIRRHHVAETFAVPIASLHRPENTCWSWSLDFFRYRPETGFKNWFLRVSHVPGSQANTHVWFLGIGAFRLVRQAWANEPRYRRAA